MSENGERAAIITGGSQGIGPAATDRIIAVMVRLGRREARRGAPAWRR
jgi:NAD(P)-dependent dehydrogenase (short-subunit alcohol dehydrogenase family)